MPHVHVQAIKGRSEEHKKAIAEALTKALMESANVKREQCFVTYEETEREQFPEYVEKNIKSKPDTIYIFKGDETR